MLQGTNLSLQIQGRPILNNINIALRPGEVTAIVGPNGAGKSTLLKVLTGEHNRYKGLVTINGKNTREYSPAALSFVRAVLPQSTQVQFSFSVEQVISIGRHARRHTKKENERIIEEVMLLTNTHNFRQRNYQTLSGGEKQRVQLARVLAQVWEETLYPRYILLDEPTSSLDMAQQQVIFHLARKVCERNIGVMAIIHDLNHAVQHADQLCFMREGHMVAQGNAIQVFTKPIIEETFNCHVNIYHDPCNNCPYIIPDARVVHNQNLKLIQND